jgi:hypothetical protein
MKLDSRDEYIPNSNNPEFGKIFEFKTTLPQQKDLCIRVKDYDLISLDDVIGKIKYKTSFLNLRFCILCFIRRNMD